MYMWVYRASTVPAILTGITYTPFLTTGIYPVPYTCKQAAQGRKTHKKRQSSREETCGQRSAVSMEVNSIDRSRIQNSAAVVVGQCDATPGRNTYGYLVWLSSRPTADPLAHPVVCFSTDLSRPTCISCFKLFFLWVLRTAPVPGPAWLFAGLVTHPRTW